MGEKNADHSKKKKEEKLMKRQREVQATQTSLPRLCAAESMSGDYPTEVERIILPIISLHTFEELIPSLHLAGEWSLYGPLYIIDALELWGPVILIQGTA